MEENMEENIKENTEERIETAKVKDDKKDAQTASENMEAAAPEQKRTLLSSGKAKGIFFILLAAASFSIMNTLVKLAGSLPSYEKSFFRNIVALAIAITSLMRKGEPLHVPKGAGKYLFARAALGTAGILCNFYAVDHMLLADASLLNKTSPFFAIVFSVFLMKEKIRPAHIAILAAVTFGCVLVLHPSFENPNLFAGLIALTGGATAGAAYSIVRKLSSLKVGSVIIVLCFSAFSCLVTLPLLIIGFQPMTLRQFLILMGTGCFGAIGQLSITTAYSCAPAREISVFSYTQIIFSALWGLLFFGQFPDAMSWIGYAIIIGMAVLMNAYNQALYNQGMRRD